MINLIISSTDKPIYLPMAEGSITWSTERAGTPGKLSFSVIQDERLSFAEGDHVRLMSDDIPIFYGFVFEKKRGRENVISVTAYDQLRYLKNKDTYVYENKTATEVIRKIADDFLLKTGELEDTAFKIESRVEEDKTLMDIIMASLDLTLVGTGELYVLYDDFGKITLKSLGNMKSRVLINAVTAQDYDYSSSIDSDTYNQVKLSFNNEKTGKKDIYMSSDTETIKRWGVLQYYKKIDQGDGAQAKADSYLTSYNRKTRKLSVKGALGDIGVRAGCLIPVYLDLGDMAVNSHMMADKVTHRWEGTSHSMDLTLRGGDFIV